MSGADIDALRSEYQAMTRRDWDALFSPRVVHPDFEFKTPERGLELSGVFRGPEDARRVFADFFGPFEAVSIEPEAFFEGDDRVVVFFLQRCRPKGSSAFVEARAAHLWTMRNGKAARLEIFPQREKALEAAGLADQPRAEGW
jgi:ketosteroid isomerase-like protein